jgi:hypothetical protein
VETKHLGKITEKEQVPGGKSWANAERLLAQIGYNVKKKSLPFLFLLINLVKIMDT